MTDVLLTEEDAAKLVKKFRSERADSPRRQMMENVIWLVYDTIDQVDLDSVHLEPGEAREILDSLPADDPS